MDNDYREFYKEDAVMEVNINNHIRDGLNRLEFFLQTIKSTHPSSFNLITTELSKKFEISEYTPKIEKKNYQFLQNHPILLNNACGALISPILSETTINDGIKTVKINVKSLLRSRLLFSYQIALSLTSVMSREKSIRYFQDVINQETKKMRDPSKYVENLDILTKDVEFFKLFQGHNFVECKIQEGKVGFKMVKCKWYEVMKELNDPDFSYAVCCHGDFEATKNMNPNFVLTRQNTIMEGQDYCDFCYHDTRLVDQVEHPPKEFWEDLKDTD